MRRLFVLLLLAALPSLSAAQLTDVSLAGQRLPLHVSVDPAYQSFTIDDRIVTEISVPVSIYLPLRRNWGLSVRAAWADASGEGLATLSGITDAQAYLSFHQPVGPGSVVMSAGFNLPSGKQALSGEEFETLTLISRNQYDFHTPSFGHGLGVSPGLTLAFPLGEAVVAGIGAAYQYRGAFEPLENMLDAYRPGGELLITAGLDVRFSTALYLSADVTYATYRADRLGAEEVFAAGDKIVAGGRLRYVARINQFQLAARYRSRDRNSLPAIDRMLVEEDEKAFPDEVEVFADHRTRLAGSLYGSVMGEARFFGAAPLLPDLRQLFGAGAGLELAVSPRLHLPARFLYQFGDLAGLEAALGLRLRL